ncbi:MAG TPA: glycosyltransferase family 2 protein [Tepidisphaeraceae bacterium]|nr:glycosyltransferase family 2 protein [Tepidisphaeraceae bacterium]
MIAPAYTLASQPVVDAPVTHGSARSPRVRRRAASVTVLTPLLDCPQYFPDMQRSVMSQSGAFDLQWIVIDGGSRDETLSQLRSIKDSRLQWVSEPDSGQAAAINKGLSMARGDIIAWLNGDDLYTPGALAAAVDAFNANPEAQWLVGRCNIVDEGGQQIRRSISRYKDRLMRNYSFKALLRMNMINQPAVFWRRSFGQSIGPLDDSLYYTMDYDLWLRMAKRRKPLILDHVLASFRVHGGSKSHGGCRAQFLEGYRVACRHVAGDTISRWVHRLNVEKVVWGYRALRVVGQ